MARDSRLSFPAVSRRRFLAAVRPARAAAPAAGLLVENGRVSALLPPGAQPPVDDERVEFPPGALLLPALGDGHLHLAALGRQGRELKLHGLGYEDCLAAVAASAKPLPPGAWITGHGWDQNAWRLDSREGCGGWPRAAALESASGGRPVSLRRIDGHAAWVSRTALKVAGISAASADPAGGAILKDERGAPLGILVDHAMKFMAAVLPKRDAESVARDLLEGQARMLAAGALRLHDMDIDDATAAAYRALAAAEKLPARVTAYAGSETALAAELLRTGPRRHGESLHFAGIKIYADGALGSRGARLLRPYHDDPGNRGLSLWDDETLSALLRRCADAGLQVAAHAIGDGACRQLLDRFERLGGAPRALRWRLEHAQIVDPGDVARLAALGPAASIQPGHAVGDAPWAAARLGAERMRGAYAYRTLEAAGIPLVIGSDAPIDDERPLWQFHCAVRRRGFDGAPPGGFRNQESLSPASVLHAQSAALAGLTGDGSGGLAVGAPADFTVLSTDVVAAPEAAANCRVLGVWRDGERLGAPG